MTTNDVGHLFFLMDVFVEGREHPDNSDGVDALQGKLIVNVRRP